MQDLEGFINFNEWLKKLYTYNDSSNRRKQINMTYTRDDLELAWDYAHAKGFWEGTEQAQGKLNEESKG